MNLKNLPLEAKNTIMAVAFITFFISPVFWGDILLMAIGAYMAPWPAVIVILTIILVGMSWMILWNRLKSDWLLAFDILSSAALLLSLIGTNKTFGLETNYTWMAVIYMSCALQLFLHMNLALFVGLGFVITQKESTPEPALA